MKTKSEIDAEESGKKASINEYDTKVLGVILGVFAFIFNLGLPLVIRFIFAILILPLLLFMATFLAYTCEWESSIASKFFEQLRILIFWIKRLRHKKRHRYTMVTILILLLFCIVLSYPALFLRNKKSTNGILNEKIISNCLVAKVEGQQIVLNLKSVNSDKEYGTYTATFVSPDAQYVIAIKLPALSKVELYELTSFDNKYKSTINVLFSDGSRNYAYGGLKDMISLDVTFHDADRNRFQGKLYASLSINDGENKYPLLTGLQSATDSNNVDSIVPVEQIVIFDEFDFSI